MIRITDDLKLIIDITDTKSEIFQLQREEAYGLYATLREIFDNE